MRRSINKSLIMLYLSFLLLLTTSCAPTLKDRVKALEKAYNSHNVEKVLSLVAADLRFEVSNGLRWVVEGKEQLRKDLEQRAILNSRIIFTDLKVNGDTVTCKGKDQGDLLKAAGIDALYYEYVRFTFEDGLIKQVEAKLTQDTARALREKWPQETEKEK